MKIEVGNRVTSTDVPMKNYGRISQPKHLEVVELCEEGMVRCIYFSEKETSPVVELFSVKLDSLKFVSNEGLKYRGIEVDPFVVRNYLNTNNTEPLIGLNF